MQNNNEQIFDGFIRDRLENIVPDMILLNSSFNTFLLKRSGKGKKRRWFFWLFLLLPFLVMPFGYYIISGKMPFANTGLDSSKTNTLTDSTDAGNSLNPERVKQVRGGGSAFAAQKDFGDSVQFHLVEDNRDEDLNTVQGKEKLKNEPKTVTKGSMLIKNMMADSAILPPDRLQKMVLTAADSVIRIKDRPAERIDTFYIVW